MTTVSFTQRGFKIFSSIRPAIGSDKTDKTSILTKATRIVFKKDKATQHVV